MYEIGNLLNKDGKVIMTWMVESVRGGKSGRGWSQSSCVEFDAKLLANSLALSDDEVINFVLNTKIPGIH